MDRFHLRRVYLSMREPSNKPNPLGSVGAIVGVIGGWSLSQYCGASIWIPGVAFLLFILLFTKGPIRPKRFSGALAATAAHVTWFIAGSAITGIWAATLLDIAALSLGVIWLWWRPNLPAVLFLGLIQFASLVFNMYALSSVSFGSAAHRALTAHCVFRLIAISCLIAGYLRMRRALSNPPPVPSGVSQ